MIASLFALLIPGVQLPTAPPPDAARLFRRCIACHALESGRSSPAGPTLHNIVDRRIAAEPGFRYSPAMQTYAGANSVWTPDLLDRFLADPMSVVPGTDMSFQGLDDPEQRRNLIRWLAQPEAGTD